MKTDKFKWDDNALAPDSIVFNFSPLSNVENDKVTFYELARTDLVNFIDESLEKKVVAPLLDEENKPLFNEDGSAKFKNKPFKDVESEHTEYFFKYLAISTRGAKDAKYFATLPITIKGINTLVEMFLTLNHVEEVLGTSGNFLMLPTMTALLSEAVDENQSSDPQAQILPVP